MDLKATIAAGYRNRLILISAGTLLYASWCLYDALIGYPGQVDIFTEYNQIKEKHPEDWQGVWADKIEETGWPEQPEEMTDWNITTQWLQFGIVFPIGAYCLFSVAMWSRRFIAVDDQKLYSHGGVEIPFTEITGIEASRWESKGIAYVQYDQGSVLIDDWKYDREPADQIFARLREHVDADKIEGLTESDASDANGQADQDEPLPEQDESTTPTA